jgi:hypothetical protein
MFARLAFLALALLAAGTAFASRQTHELIKCSSGQGGITCFGEDGNNPLYQDVKIQSLYRDGWRLVFVETAPGSRTIWWLERPITPQQ